MILSEIRASAYRIAAAVFGVLAVALLVVALFLWGRLALRRCRRAGEKARAAELRAEALSQAMAAMRCPTPSPRRPSSAWTRRPPPFHPVCCHRGPTPRPSACACCLP